MEEQNVGSNIIPPTLASFLATPIVVVGAPGVVEVITIEAALCCIELSRWSPLNTTGHTSWWTPELFAECCDEFHPLKSYRQVWYSAFAPNVQGLIAELSAITPEWLDRNEFDEALEASIRSLIVVGGL